MPHYNSSEAIILCFEPPFAILTLNQPSKKNALSLDLYKQLASLLQVSLRQGHSYEPWLVLQNTHSEAAGPVARQEM